MTQEKKQEIESFLKNKGINIATLITVVSAIFYMGYAQAEIRKDLDYFKDHINNKEIHMSFERRSEIFVPRTELENRLRSMEALLIRIEQRINNE